tara:strand:+ start:2781 stop:3536 length:756 start_codon:yes stop_codon:yes gene_type:complete
MGRPGNKRLQRALYGASPSAEKGSSVTFTYFSNGRKYTKSRLAGSVVNNGGNMIMGTYPTVGVGLPFLLKLSGCCKPGANVQKNNVPMEDVGDVVVRRVEYRKAVSFISSTTAAEAAARAATTTAAGVLTTAQGAAALTLPLVPTAADIAAKKAAEVVLDAAFADWTAKKALSDLLTARLNAATTFEADYSQTELDRNALVAAIDAFVAATPGATAAAIAADPTVAAAQTNFDNSVSAEQVSLDAFVAIMA